MRLTTWRLGPAVVVVVCLVLGACGGGTDEEGSRDGGVVDNGGEDSGGDGGGGDDGGGDDEVGSPPTAGPGEAGVFTGPSGGEDPYPDVFVIYGCGDIDAVRRLDNGEFEQLLDELQCIFDNAERMPPEVIAEAEQAAELARQGIEERDSAETTETTEITETTETTETTEPATTGTVTTGSETTEPATTVTTGSETEPETTTSG